MALMEQRNLARRREREGEKGRMVVIEKICDGIREEVSFASNYYYTKLIKYLLPRENSYLIIIII